MTQHPGIELQDTIREKGLTQKAFSTILGKKISEVNELLKGKRNITIQWDYLLHQALGTPIKYWIMKQIDYDYSLILPIGFEGNKIDITQNPDKKYEENLSEKTDKNQKIVIGKSPVENNKQDNEDLETAEEKINNTKESNDDLERAKIFRSF